MVGRGQVYVPFWLSDLREIKKDLGSYIDVLDQYIRAGTSRLLNVSLNKTKT
jgi:hypothetical protein